MSIKTAAQWLGQEVSYCVPNSTLGFRVVITDVKAVYGEYHYQIQPVNGGGSAWVKRSSLVGVTTVNAKGESITY